VQNEELQAQSEELRVANEALAESEERFRTMANAIPQLAWIAKVDGYIYWYNERWYAYTGTTPEQMEGWGWESVHDPALLPKVLEQWKASIAKGQMFDMEFPLRGADGLYHQFLTRGFPLKDAKGQVLQWFGTNTDITERKQDEEKLKKQAALIDLSPDAIISRQLDGTINFWSKGAQLLYGWTRQEAIGQKTHTLLKTKFSQPLEQIIKQLQQTGYWSGELIHCTKDDKQVIVQSRWQAEFDDQGNVLDMLESNVDITEHKRMEDKLKQSVKQYQTLGDTIPYGVWITDAEGYCTYASDSFLELLGVSMEQVQKFGWMDRLPPEDVQSTTDHWLHCVQTGEDFEHEHRFRAKDGSYRNVLAIGRSVWDESGRITEWVGLNLDVTERRKMEEALKEARDSLEERVKERTAELEKAFSSLKKSEKSLAEAQKIAHLGNWEWNIKADKINWSEETYRIFGRNLQEFDATYVAFLSYIHPDDRLSVNNAVIEALSGKHYNIEFRIILANGENRVVHAQGETSFGEDNTPVILFGTVQDITERKKTEEKLQEAVREKSLILDNINASVAFHDIDNCFVWANKFYLESIGKHTSELKGRKCHDCWGLDQLCLNCPVIEAMRTDQPQEGEMTPENQPHWPPNQGSWLVRAAPVKNANGKIIGAIEVAHDITERKKAEEALEKIDKIRIKEIHHRIKNNLQVISSMLDLQSEMFEDEKVKEAFREGQDRVISMALIHEELYKGKGIDTDTLDFSAYLQKLAKSLFQTYNFSNKNIHLSMDMEENTFFDMDTAVPLGIIVNELISNSLKHAFTEKEDGEILIKLHREENGESINSREESENEDCESTGYVLKISDDGIGIPEDIEIEDLDSLGMQLVTTLVDQLDGELELKRNNGTEFTLRFAVIEKNN